jgi:predicted nucleotidyltransferase
MGGKMILHDLQKQNLIQPPKWLSDNCCYLTIMGSEAYGVSSGDSDKDVYGVTIPPKDLVFPHLAGHIDGFGRQIQRFDVWQQHHIPYNEKEYDFAVYSIVRYFHLCMENNPNMIDSLFTPRRCVIHITPLFEYVRENRKEFLHKGCFHKLKGYAYAQLQKIKNKKPSNDKRAADVEVNGFDTKFAYHLVRLLNECEQILVKHDLDLEENNEQLKSIRRGEWGLDRIVTFFESREKSLDLIYAQSTLRHEPDEKVIKNMLLHCLEIHYGSLDNAIKKDNNIVQMINELENVIQKYR